MSPELKLLLIAIALLIGIIAYACCTISGDSMKDAEKDYEILAQEYAKRLAEKEGEIEDGRHNDV